MQLSISEILKAISQIIAQIAMLLSSQSTTDINPSGNTGFKGVWVNDGIANINLSAWDGGYELSGRTTGLFNVYAYYKGVYWYEHQGLYDAKKNVMVTPFNAEGNLSVPLRLFDDEIALIDRQGKLNL